MNNSKSLDKDIVKQAANGRWKEILTSLCGISSEILDNRHHPCPKCGGKDRFRALNDFNETGALFCNQCFNKKNGDGLAAVMWLKNCSFAEALRLVADYLGIQGKVKKPSKPKKARFRKDLVFEEWNSVFFPHFAGKKPGVSEKSLRANGARFGYYKDRFPVYALPIFGKKLDTDKPVGWVMMDALGSKLPKWDRDGNVVDNLKYKLASGSKAGLIGLHAINKLEAGGPVRQIWKVEGVSDLLALSTVLDSENEDAVVLTNSNGTMQKPDWMAELLANHHVYVIHDADKPGQEGAKLWAEAIANSTTDDRCEVRNVQLPFDIKSTQGKDLRDFLQEGHDYKDLRKLADVAPIQAATPKSGNTHSGINQSKSRSEGENECDENGKSGEEKLPDVFLPGLMCVVSRSAKKLGELLAKKQEHFNRGGTVCCIAEEHIAKAPMLINVDPKQFASDIEKVAKLFKWRKGDESVTPEPHSCSAADANLIMHCQDFLAELPAIDLVSPGPVLVEVEGKLVEVSGYHEQSRVYAFGSPVEQVDLDKAKELLSQVIDGFQFATPSDRSRALASLITPALTMGQLLPGRAPIDLSEADQSQSGKGFRNKLTSAIYDQITRTVAEKDGIGSLDEGFDAVLISGAVFVSLDNIRGKVNSQCIESFMTEPTYNARPSYSKNTLIDPKRVTVMFTSNRADITRDLANRCSCTRILKQPPNHQYARFPEGDILDHVTANQSLFLGAVFAVIKAWHEAGKPRTKETRHDFRGWAQPLDWIIQNLLDAPPLLDGHQDTQARMVNPHLNWLRDVVQAVEKARRQDERLRTHHLIDILDGAGVEIPGLLEGGDLEDDIVHRKALTAMGKRMGKCFTDDEVVVIGNLAIERSEFKDDDYRARFQYRVTSASDTTLMESSATSSDEVGLQQNESVCKDGNDLFAASVPQKPAAPAMPRDTPALTPAIKPETPATPARESINV